MYVGAGDRVLVEQPGYPGGLDIVADLGARGRAGAGPRRLGRPGLRGAGHRGPADRAAGGVPDPRLPEPDRRRAAGRAARGGRPGAGRGPHGGGDRRVAGRALARVRRRCQAVRDLRRRRAGRHRGLGQQGRSGAACGSAGCARTRSRSAGWPRCAPGSTCPARSWSSWPARTCCPSSTRSGPSARCQLRAQRRALVGALHRHLPEWAFEVPGGRPGALVRAARAGVGGARRGRRRPGRPDHARGRGSPPTATLESWLRLPYTRPGDELTVAVELLAQAWAALRSPSGGAARWTPTRRTSSETPVRGVPHRR